MQLTNVSRDLIAVDYKVLVEMTDGQLIELSTPWGTPTEPTLRTWKWKTRTELTTLAQNHNCDRKYQQWARVDADKVRRFGHDYASRGY